MAATGPADGSVVLIEVNGESAEYWAAPGGRIESVISPVKSKVTAERYDGGENERVTL